jgi:predicted N-acetyltransferase YhbS
VTVHVRLAQPADYAEIGKLTVAAYEADGFIGTESSYADELRNAADRASHAELWVAAEDPSLLGTVTFCPPGSHYRELGVRPDQGEFRMLAVAPAARRRGVGKVLVARCLERSRELGHTEMVLCSGASMTSAHALYASFGFVRAPELDWRPRPEILLWGFRLAL